MTGTYTVGLTSDATHLDGTSLFGDIDVAPLTAAGLKCRFVEFPSTLNADAALTDLDAVISFGHAPFDAGTARRFPRLKHVARFGAGYDGIEPTGLAGEGVVVTTTSEAVQVPMAQAGLTLVLACAHRLIENNNVVIAGKWADQRGRYRGIGLAGKTVGIVGLGSVGTILAQYVRDLGGNVIASGQEGSRSRASRIGVQFVDLMSLATASDFVVVCTALTPETKGLIGGRFLDRMPTHGYLINIARGGLVDQTALVAALRVQSIAGCALDVLEDEPPGPENSLLHMGNVILSPHALCWTEQFTRNVWASVVASVLKVAAGEIPQEALVRHLLDPHGWRGVVLAEGRAR